MMLRPAAVFSDNMVLQQGVPVPVWGKAAPGAAVSCRLEPAGAAAAGTADADGCWRLMLPALPAGCEFTGRMRNGG